MVLVEAEAAVPLVTQGTYPPVGVADPGLGHRYLLGAGQPLAQRPGCLVGDVSCAIDVNLHIGAVVLYGLEAAYGHAELYPLLGVVGGHLQHCLAGTGHLHALAHRPQLDDLLHQRPALVRLAQYVLPGHLHLVEGHLAQLVRGDGLEHGAGYPRALGIHYEQGDALLLVGRLLCPGGTQQVVGYMHVGDEELGAADDVVIAIGGGLDRYAVGLV